jgi:two-component system phosphate regulon sensor histidine kinase PhoR
MDSLYYETITRNLRDAARFFHSSLPAALLQGAFTGGGRGDLAAFMDSLEKSGPYRLTLISKDGTVAADSRSIPENMENHGDRPEVRAALEGKEGVARRGSASLGTELIYAALPAYDPGGRISGVFRLSLEVPSFWRRISSAALPFLVLATLFFFAALTGVYLFSRSLSRSFARLEGIAQSVHRFPDTFSEVLSTPPLISDTEEFRALEQAFKDMAAELVTRIDRAQTEGRRLEAILNGMSEGVFATDAKLKLLLVNPRARSLFGIGAETDITALSLLEAAHSPELEETAEKVLSGGVLEEREIAWHTGGIVRHFQVFAAPLYRDRGGAAAAEIEGVVLVVGDISRLYKLEQVRKDFAANVSHELRTPIQIIKGFAETLLDSSL